MFLYHTTNSPITFLHIYFRILERVSTSCQEQDNYISFIFTSLVFDYPVLITCQLHFLHIISRILIRDSGYQSMFALHATNRPITFLHINFRILQRLSTLCQEQVNYVSFIFTSDQFPLIFAKSITQSYLKFLFLTQSRNLKIYISFSVAAIQRYIHTYIHIYKFF